MRCNFLFIAIFLFSTLFYPQQSVLAAKEKKIRFSFDIEAEEELVDKLQQVLEEIEDSSNYYLSSKQVDYWENEARKSLNTMLKSFGYYESLIESQYKEEDNYKIIELDINLGDRYTIKDVSISHADGSNQNIDLPPISILTTKAGEYVNVYDIKKDEAEIWHFLDENNCLLDHAVAHKAIVDHLNDQISIIFLIDASEQANIRNIIFDGLKTVEKDYVKKLVKLKPGQCFHQSDIADARSDLQKSNLFIATTPSIPAKPDKDGLVDVTFNLQERKMRRIKIGANFSSDQGMNGIIEWEHKNLFGQGEILKAKTGGRGDDQIIETTYIKPFFLRDDQKLNIGARYEYDSNKVFEARVFDIAAGIDRELTPIWTAGVRGKASFTKAKPVPLIKDSFEVIKKKHSLISLPIYVERDNRDNLLNATKGTLARFEIEPFTSAKKKNHISFLKTNCTLSGYHKIHENFVLALKAETGSIFKKKKDSADDIPITEKFFLGGSKSLRGYKHNLIGESVKKNIDGTNKVIRIDGGLSFVELNASLRIKLKHNFGIVGFVDAGRTSNETKPKINNLRYSVGVGFRYYTSFAPLRIDIATPIKGRDNIDRGIQLYFGIGQSF